MQDFLWSVAVQIVAAAWESHMLAVGNEGLEGFRIPIGQRAASGGVGLEQQGRAADAGEQRGEVIAIEPAPFDDGCEHLRVELAEALGAPSQRGSIAQVAEAFEAAAAGWEANVCEGLSDYFRATARFGSCSHANEKRLPRAVRDAFSHGVKGRVFEDDAAHPVRQLRRDRSGHHGP